MVIYYIHSRLSVERTDNKTSLAVIAGVSGGGLFVLILIVVIIMVIYRKRRLLIEIGKGENSVNRHINILKYILLFSSFLTVLSFLTFIYRN